MADLGLVEIFLQQHGTGGPSTYNRGSHPIDGIYVSMTLQGIRCRYDEFVLDQRLRWAEIPLSIALGHNVPPSVKPKARRLKCKDPRVVSRYLKEYRKADEHGNFFQRATSLCDQATRMSDIKVKCEYDILDRDRYLSMMHADKHCRKLKLGEKQWSPDYEAAREQVALWKLVVRKKQGKKVASRFLNQQMKKCRETGALQLSFEDFLERRNAAYRAEKIVAKVTVVSRKTWLESLCKARAEAGQTFKEQELRNMIRLEEQRRNARLISRVNGKLRAGSVTSVIASDLSGNRVEVTKKEDIDKALCNENERRFNQAKDTPFLQEPLLTLVGSMGTGRAAEAMLNVNFIIPKGSINGQHNESLTWPKLWR